MGHNQDDLLQYVYSIYKQLTHLQKEQLFLLEANEVDWAAIISLIEQWNDLSRSVEGLITSEQIEAWKQNSESKVILSTMEKILIEMTERARDIEQKIVKIKAETSNDLQDTKVHQTVLHAYGGLNRPNMDSIYLDQRK